MKIKLISQQDYNTLKNYSITYPNLVYQNKGYDGIDKTKLSEDEITAIENIEDVLKRNIEGFNYFQNFRINQRTNNLEIRFNYQYDERFSGVGYIYLDELLHGFK